MALYTFRLGTFTVNFWGHVRELLSAAFFFVAALAWNEAIKSLIDLLPLQSGGNIVSKFFYALVVSSIAILVLKALQKRKG